MSSSFSHEQFSEFMKREMRKMFEDSMVNQILNSERQGDTTANNDYTYLEMFCCGQEMSYVFQNKKIVMAYCQICKKEWRPNPFPNPEIKTHYVGVDFGKEGDKVGFRNVRIFGIDLEKEDDNAEQPLSRDLSIRPIDPPSSES